MFLVLVIGLEESEFGGGYSVFFGSKKDVLIVMLCLVGIWKEGYCYI